MDEQYELCTNLLLSESVADRHCLATQTRTICNDINHLLQVQVEKDTIEIPRT